MITVYHTSPKKITEINKDGMFDDCLFFSDDVYSMSVGSVYVYTIELNNTIEVNSFFYHDDYLKLNDIVSNIVNVADVTEDEARDLLDGTDESSDGDISWFIQAKQGEAAKVLGYEAAEAEDEQGAVYIVPMLDKLNELTLKEKLAA